jgi:hypothetical protein
MQAFLTFIGVANALGAVLLFAAMHPRFSDLVLRRWTWILPQDQPYPEQRGPAAWAGWAAVGTVGFAWLNLRALSWAPLQALEVVRLDVLVYGGFEVLALVGTLSRRWGPGLWFAHVLWIGQGSWGAWLLMSVQA